MLGETLLPVAGLILSLLLLVAAITDLRARIIPNPLNAVIALLAPLAWWAQGLALWPDIAVQIGVALAVFAPFVLLFAIGGIGGGDVKLVGALALWIAPRFILPMLFVMAVVGGVIAAIMLVRHRLGDAEGTPEVPYGVAIAVAGWWVVHQQYLNHFLSLPSS